jgi:hypothetical protein
MTHRPDQLRLDISDDIGAAVARPEYIQVAGDAFRASYEPMAPDLVPEQLEGLRHLLYHVEVRDITFSTRDKDKTRCRAVVNVYALCAIRTMGEDDEGRGAPVESWDQALAIARHLWYRLSSCDRRIMDIETIPEESSYTVTPLTVDWLMPSVRIPVLFYDTLEA